MLYTDIFESFDSFLAFDISVQSTGWCKWENGKLKYGSFGLTETNELGRRMEFRDAVIALVDNKSYDFIAVEDVIGGCNFKTTKMLVQLNCIIDDLVYLETIPYSKVERIDNGVWKKYLKEVANYKSTVRGFDKEEIRKCLESMGFQAKVQDIYDSVGVAIGAIERMNKPLTPTSVVGKIKADLTKSYTLKLYNDKNLETIKEKYNLPVINITYDRSYRDILIQFKNFVSDNGDNAIFVIDAPIEKYGVLALSGKLPVTVDENRIIAYKKSLK